MFWVTLALISASFSALAALIEKHILFTEDATAFSFVFAVLSALIALPLLHGVPFSAISPAAAAMLFVKTALGSAAFLFVMESIKRLELSGSLPMLALTPAVAAAGGMLLLGETLAAREWAGLFIMLAGTYLLQLDGKTAVFEPFFKLFRTPGYRYILAALAIFAATALMDKAAIAHYKMKPGVVLGLNQLFQAFCFWVLFVMRGRKGGEAITLFKRCFKPLLALTVITLVYRWAQIEAVKLAPVALVLALKRTSVFMGAAAGGKFYNEHNVLRRSTAAAIMVAGAFLIMNNAG